MVYPRGLTWFHPRRSMRSSAKTFRKTYDEVWRAAPLNQLLNRSTTRWIIRSLIEEIGRLTILGTLHMHPSKNKNFWNLFIVKYLLCLTTGIFLKISRKILGVLWLSFAKTVVICNISDLKEFVIVMNYRNLTIVIMNQEIWKFL